jgi:hypothetical protein
MGLFVSFYVLVAPTMGRVVGPTDRLVDGRKRKVYGACRNDDAMSLVFIT